MRVSFAGERRALSVPSVRRVVDLVLDGEGEPHASIAVTFQSDRRMRKLNRDTFGRDHTTDVIAFGMRHGNQLVGDIYVCPSAARRAARERGIPPRQELIRVLVHGLLHAVGLDHPDGTGREASPMWKRQENYVDRFLGVKQ